MIKLISGGQTGADRGALDAALACGVPCGGACPAGRLAEDGRIPDRYPLIELESRHYLDRTLHNVVESDGTVIFYFDELEGGTEKTASFCLNEEKPYLLIDGNHWKPDEAAVKISSFVKEHEIVTLNVAGPRESKVKKAHDYAMKTITAFLSEGGFCENPLNRVKRLGRPRAS